MYRVLTIDKTTVKYTNDDQKVDTKFVVIDLEAIGDKDSQMNCSRRDFHCSTNWLKLDRKLTG